MIAGRITVPTKDYVSEVEEYFEDVALKNGVITAKSSKATDELSVWATDASYEDVVKFSRKGKEKSPKTGNRFAKPNAGQGTLHATSVSSEIGAKVIKDLEDAKQIYKKVDRQGRHTKGFLPFISTLLHISQDQKHGGRKYRTFRLDNGSVLTVRLGGHNTAVHTYDENGENNALSIVISAKKNRGIKNDGNAHVVEYYYDNMELMNAEGQPQYEIINSLLEALATGEFIDRTGVAKRQEVNYSNTEYRKMLDDIYLSHVEDGNIEKVASMVQDAARNLMDESAFLDSDGTPHVFYHNTPNEFTVFDASKNGTHNDAGWLGDGFYFYGIPNEGNGYGKHQMRVFLDIRNPYYATAEEVERLAEANSREESLAFRQRLEEEGYDGVYYDGDLRQEAVAFHPNQIKSADAVTRDDEGNVIPLSERFNSEKDDIRYSRKRDAEYKAAVESGDVETYIRMLEEEAKAKGYSSDSEYQGKSAFNGSAPSAHEYYETPSVARLSPRMQ